MKCSLTLKCIIIEVKKYNKENIWLSKGKIKSLNKQYINIWFQNILDSASDRVRREAAAHGLDITGWSGTLLSPVWNSVACGDFLSLTPVRTGSCGQAWAVPALAASPPSLGLSSFLGTMPPPHVASVGSCSLFSLTEGGNFFLLGSTENKLKNFQKELC